MPIIMLWLGIGDASKTIVIGLGVSLPVIYHSYQGARAVEEKLTVVRRGHGNAARRTPAADRAAGRACRKSLSAIRTGLGAGAHHHGHQ